MSIGNALTAQVRAWFLPTRIGPSFSEQQRASVQFYVSAADARAAVERDDSPQGAPVSVLLLRDEAICMLRAFDVSRNPSKGEADVLAILDESGFAPVVEKTAAMLRKALLETDCLAFDRMSGYDVESLRGALQDLISRLRASIDLRTDSYIKVLRFLRVGVGALLLVFGLYSVIIKIITPTNVALGKPVTMSSRHPGTPDPSGLVDGSTGGSYGACTFVGSTEPPWIVVDLLQVHGIRKIIVYNRGDTNQDDGLPFTVSSSVDGTNYTELAKRDTHFGSGGPFSAPWTISTRTQARYIKIQAQKYIALSELEVFDKD